MKLTGLVAATFTPMDVKGNLKLDIVGPIVDHLVATGVRGLYVCGSTGEGVSLSSEEREETAKAYVDASAGRLPVVIQVGHNALVEAQRLAAHAQSIGADAISATPPTYFKPDSTENLIQCLSEITSAAPSLPFYYYHIPIMSGVDVDVLDFLRKAPEHIPSLAGVKYSHRMLQEFQICNEFEDGRFNMLFGADEMLLSAVATGADGAVGSTYNYLAPVYNQVIESVKAGDVEAAQAYQMKAVAFVRLVLEYRGLAGLKAVMKLIGLDCGPNRLPIRTLNESEVSALRKGLEDLGFFQWTKRQ